MQHETTPPTATDDLTILNGGIMQTVGFIDGREKEEIKIRQLPMRLMPAYGDAAGDEPKLLELFTGKPADWVENLLPVDQERIVEIGDRLNLDPFVRWSVRRLAASDRMAQVLEKAKSSGKSAPPSSPGADTSRNSSQS